MKNPVMACCAVLQLGACVWAATNRDWAIAVLYFSFAVGSATVSTMG